jgi:hypothetical protein
MIARMTSEENQRTKTKKKKKKKARKAKGVSNGIYTYLSSGVVRIIGDSGLYSPATASS